MYDHVIFDFDGTLADTGPGIMESAAYALRSLGYPHEDEAMLRRFVGPPLPWSFREVCHLPKEQIAQAAELFRKCYREGAIMRSTIYTGIPRLLRALKHNGVNAIAVSGKNEPALIRLLEHFDLMKLFGGVRGGDLAHPSADKSQMMRSMLPEGVDMDRVCVVGDRRFDVNSGKELGAHTIWVDYGYGEPGEKEACAPDEAVASVDALTHALLGDAPLPRGTMITFEGMDGCGKSTQIELLAKWLRERGEDVVLTREPGGCPISERVREVILSLDSTGMSAECEALLYAASRIEHVREVILPALQRGKVILCDRFLDSSIAYQAWGRELGEAFIRQINRAASDLVTPDITLYLALTRAEAKDRVGRNAPLDRLEREEEPFFARLREGYEAIATREPGRVKRIDASGTIEEIFARIRSAVQL